MRLSCVICIMEVWTRSHYGIAMVVNNSSLAPKSDLYRLKNSNNKNEAKQNFKKYIPHEIIRSMTETQQH